MAMRDLIPWGRQEGQVPALYGNDERSPWFRFRHEVDRLFDDFFRAPMLGGWSQPLSWPSLEVNESDNEIRVTADLPGLTEKDVELSIQDGMLAIRGEKKSENEDRNRGWSERYYGRFERRIALPDGADEDHCDATFRDGVLTVRIPRSAEKVRSRKIPINGGTRH